MSNRSRELGEQVNASLARGDVGGFLSCCADDVRLDDGRRENDEGEGSDPWMGGIGARRAAVRRRPLSAVPHRRPPSPSAHLHPRS